MGLFNILKTTTVSSGDVAGGIIAALGAFLIFFVLIGLAITIVSIISQWKMFEKGGKPGWSSIIPVYNTYVMCDMVGVNPWWILIVLLSPILSVVPLIGTLAQLAITVYFGVLLAVSTAKAFGKETGFGILLYFIPFVGYCILGFGKDKYVGKNPMHDIVFDDWFGGNKKNASNFTANTTTVNDAPVTGSEKFCSNCGSKVSSDTKFCPSCGKEI